MGHEKILTSDQLDDRLKSISLDYCILIGRARLKFDGSRYSFTVGTGLEVNVYPMVTTVTKKFGFGNYEFYLQVGNVLAGQTQYPLFFEWQPGSLTLGIIALRIVGITYQFITATGGNSETSNLTGVNLAAEALVKYEWSSTTASVYVGGALKATHTTYVCQNPSSLCHEMGFSTTPPGSIAMYWRDFKQL